MVKMSMRQTCIRLIKTTYVQCLIQDKKLIYAYQYSLFQDCWNRWDKMRLSWACVERTWSIYNKEIWMDFVLILRFLEKTRKPANFTLVKNKQATEKWCAIGTHGNVDRLLKQKSARLDKHMSIRQFLIN